MSNKIEIARYNRCDKVLMNNVVNQMNFIEMHNELNPFIDEDLRSDDVLLARSAFGFLIIYNGIKAGAVWIFNVDWENRNAHIRIGLSSEITIDSQAVESILFKVLGFSFGTLELHKIYSFTNKDNQFNDKIMKLFKSEITSRDNKTIRVSLLEAEYKDYFEGYLRM